MTLGGNRSRKEVEPKTSIERFSDNGRNEGHGLDGLRVQTIKQHELAVKRHIFQTKYGKSRYALHCGLRFIFFELPVEGRQTYVQLCGSLDLIVAYSAQYPKNIVPLYFTQRANIFRDHRF